MIDLHQTRLSFDVICSCVSIAVLRCYRRRAEAASGAAASRPSVVLELTMTRYVYLHILDVFFDNGEICSWVFWMCACVTKRGVRGVDLSKLDRLAWIVPHDKGKNVGDVTMISAS